MTITFNSSNSKSVSPSETPSFHGARALTTAEAARYCGISEATLREGRMSGTRKGRMDVPRHTKLSERKTVYLLEDLNAWLDKKRQATDFYGQE